MKRRAVPTIVFILGVALLAVLPVLIKGLPYGPDSTAYYRICLAFYQDLRQGDWFPAWVANSSGGYGDLSVRFYPPLTFYLASLFRALTGDWHRASLLLFYLFSVVGAAGVYFWAASLTARKWAIIAAAVFCFLPFHVTELYTAFMLPQFAAAGFLAFALGCVERICQSRRRDCCYVAGLGSAYALLILTNLPLALIGSLSLALYAALRLTRSHLKRQLAALAVGATLGLLASGFFLIKVLTETKWLSGDKNHYRAWYDYGNNFLLSSGPEGSALWLVNLIAAATLVALLPSSILLLKQQRRRYAPLVVLAFAALFMATSLSKPLWLIIPKLAEVQFPWRWLSVTTITGAVIIGVAFPQWLVVARGRYRPLAILAFGVLLIAVSFSALQLMKGAVFLSREAFNGLIAQTETKEGTEADQYWLPVWARPSPSLPQPGASLVSGQTFSAANAGTIKIKTFYYPRWHAFMETESLPVSPDSDGSMLLSVPRSGEVRVVWVEPLAAQAAKALSLLVWCLLLGALIFYNFRQEPDEPEQD
ncbi:MAG: hypothetical protein QOF02_106 [Blastocatellia bacterium]|jgi:uncharacterized membrane protein|nr:hypothetical protein [Blastocatellia bacterium]